MLQKVSVGVIHSARNRVRLEGPRALHSHFWHLAASPCDLSLHAITWASSQYGSLRIMKLVTWHLAARNVREHSKTSKSGDCRSLKTCLIFVDESQSQR